jgi:hypothetical protein
MNEIENGKNGGWHGIWNKEVNDDCWALVCPLLGSTWIFFKKLCVSCLVSIIE